MAPIKATFQTSLGRTSQPRRAAAEPCSHLSSPQEPLQLRDSLGTLKNKSELSKALNPNQKLLMQVGGFKPELYLESPGHFLKAVLGRLWVNSVIN